MELLRDAAGAVISSPINASQGFGLPAATPFGNLTLKLFKILDRLAHANRRIREMHQSWSVFVSQSMPSLDDPGVYHRFTAEESVFMLRRAADEIVAMQHLLAERCRTGEYPSQLRVDSLEGALVDSSTLTPARRWLFATLNDIANVQKHSFVDSDLTIVGRDEPCITALGLRRNNLKNSEELYVVSMDELVVEFNAFTHDAFAVMRELSQKISGQG